MKNIYKTITQKKIRKHKKTIKNKLEKTKKNYRPRVRVKGNSGSKQKLIKKLKNKIK